MRHFFLALATSTALLTGACATTTPAPTTATAQVHVVTTQAAYFVELAYNGWSIAARAILHSNQGTAAQRESIRAIDRRAWTIVLAAQAGQATIESLLPILAEGQSLIQTLSPHQ